MPGKNDLKRNVEKQFTVLWIIWGALISALVIYLFMGHVLRPALGPQVSEGFPMDSLRMILMAVSALELFIIYYIRRSLLSPGPSGTITDRKGPKPVINRQLFLGKYTSVVIISNAIAESIGIYGLVLFLLGDTPQTLYLFIAVSAMAMVAFRPKRSEFDHLAVKHIFR